MKYLLEIPSLAIFLFAIAPALGGCPLTDTIAPCTCVDSTYHNLRCENISHVQVLKDVFQTCTGSGIKSFKLTLSILPHVPLDILDHVPLDRLYLRNNAFHDLFNGSLQAENVIRHLVIKHVELLNGWSWTRLRSFRHLDTLVIHSSAVGETITVSFSSEISKHIENLSLVDCGVEVIESGAFRRHKKLKYLSLPRNKLRTFFRNSLSVPSALTQLNLENNEISYLPDDIFSDMPNLTYVTLSNNALAFVSEHIFHSILWESESALELQGNPIKCDCQMEWIASTNSTGSSVFGSCAHPKQLYGRNLQELTAEDFTC